MTLNSSKFSPVVSIHVIGKHIICIKWKAYESYKSPPGRGFISCHTKYFFKDMVDCLSKGNRTTKGKNFSIKQYDDNYSSNLKQNSEHLCLKSQNNIMKKSQQSVDTSSQKQNDMSPSLVEQNCIEKAEKPQNAWQRRDSFSSCSSDSAVYCSTRHTQVNVTDEPVRILACENSHIDMTCESKRQRHSSGSSVISIASDASCKEPQPGLGRKNILGCLGASPKLCEIDASDINENIISGSHIKKTKPTLVSVSKAKQEIVVEVTPPTDAQEKMSQSSPPAVRLHDLRKNIRRKACCHGDCNETHTTFIVRRYTEIHPNPAHQHSSNTSSSKRSAPSSSTSSSSLDSSPNSNKKRKSEIDKLFAALHEIKWAKHFSPETILQHTEARRTSCTIKPLNPTDSPPGLGLSSSPPLNKGRVVLKSRSPIKNAPAKNKISPEKDAKPRESLSIRNRPSIHFLNTKNQQSHKLNSKSPPKATHKGSWLSTKKKISERHLLQRKSPEALFSDSPDSNRQGDTEMPDIKDDLEAAQTDFCDMRGNHSPIFLQIASTTKDRTSPQNQSHVCESDGINSIVSDSDSSPQSSSVEHPLVVGSGVICGNAQSTVISTKDNTLLQVSICESENCNFPVEHLEKDVDISKTEPVNSDCAPLVPLCGNQDSQHSMSVEYHNEEITDEGQQHDESCITNLENHSSHNESSELPLLSSEDSPIKNAPFNETPPVLEPCVSLPTVQHQESPISFCASHTSNHSSQNSTAGHESDSERSRASSPDVLFVTPSKSHEHLEQNIESCCIKEDQEEKQDVPSSETSSSSYPLKKVGGNRTEAKNCDMSCSKRASRLILKKYVKNSNRKANNHKHKGSSWNDDEGKMWSCVVIDGDQDHDSDEENHGSELLNHKITSLVASAESVNSSGIENNGYDDARTSTPKICEYQKQSVCDGALSSHSNKSQHHLSSSSHTSHMKKVAHTSTGVNKSQSTFFQVAHKRHKSAKTLHLKEKVNCKKSKKATAMDGSTNGNKSLHEDKKELPQEVIRLRMLYGFTFHYKGITVNKNDSYTQVILKLTTRGSIFLSVEALMELKDTLNSAGNDSNCQVLIINGIGNSFCSGLDLRPLMGPRKKDAAREMAVAVKEFIEALASFHKPLVSVVNGSAVGLGVTLLTYSDVVLASDTASFHMPYAQLGYMPEGAVTLTLPQVMRSSVAMDMLLRGTKITAHQACDHGLVSEVLEAKKLPQQLVSRVRILAESPVSAMESTKSMLRWHLYGKLHVALENEVQMLPKQWLSPACQVAIKNAFQSGLLCE